MIDQHFDVVKEQWADILWFDETLRDKKNPLCEIGCDSQTRRGGLNENK